MDLKLDLTGKVAMVTGGGSGIGREMAKCAAVLGASVVVVDVNGQTAEKTAAEISAANGSAAIVQADCRIESEVLHAYEELDRAFGHIDLLFANVGGSRHVPPEELDLATWNDLIALNLTSTFLLAREAGRRMLARGMGGSIVTLSSIAGSSALGRGSFAYSVAKAGVIQLTRELAVQWGRAGIRVNAIQPAQVRTPRLETALAEIALLPTGRNVADQMARFVASIPLGRIGETSDVAAAALFLSSDLARWITGVCLPVDGGNLVLNAGASL